MRGTYLAVDFGASNGRVIGAHIEEKGHGKTLVLEEIYRFPNSPVRIGQYLYWDFPSLFAEMKKGLSIASGKYDDIVSIGIDTWGVDFGLIDRNGNLIGNPICYRDNHSAVAWDDFTKEFDVSAHYAETGIQMLSINTLYRLMSLVRSGDPRLSVARHLLFMPDLFSFYLTGNISNEYTISSTSELLLAGTRQWNVPLIRKLGIDPSLFGDIVMPGFCRGSINQEVSEETGLPSNVKVIAVGSHDTASAVFAVADEYATGNVAFLSSGTWSLLGVLLNEPIVTEEARIAGYTNEGAADGKIRFLTNITGLWILQQLKGEWMMIDKDLSWSGLIEEAEKSRDTAIIDVDDPRFQNPHQMERNIRSYCEEHNLETPSTRGEYVRCVCRSLAERYKKAIDSLNALLPEPIEKLVIFGGGGRNTLLTRFTAEITGLEVAVRDAEATAIGNILVQAISHGNITDKKEITDIIYN